MLRRVIETLGNASKMLLVFSSLAVIYASVSCGKRIEKTERSTSDTIREAGSNANPVASIRPGHVRRVDSLVKPGSEKGDSATSPDTEPKPKLSADEFVAALRVAVVKDDPSEIRSVLEEVPHDAASAASLRAILNNPGSGESMRRYAAEALVRIGTGESVQSVFDQILTTLRDGDTDGARVLLASFEAPTTTAGYQSMFDFLLCRGTYAQSQESPPEELVAATRKALRTAPDRETVGTLATQLYLDPEVGANDAALWELFEGVSHPVMLAQLATRAYQENLPQNATQFLDRLQQHDDQGVVQALVQMTSNEAVPLDATTSVLYNWSLQHPHQAMPGLFMEYITDASQPPRQRSVAAFGLAGSANREEARRLLEKALTAETDSAFRTNLQAALTTLDRRQPSQEENNKP